MARQATVIKAAVLVFAFMGVRAFAPTHPIWGAEFAKKNRYISIDTHAFGDSPSAFHIRVMVDGTEVNGLTGSGPWWATATVDGQAPSPATCISVVSTEKPSIEPDWSSCPVIQLTGCAIVPTTTYALAAEVGGELYEAVLYDTQERPGVKWHGDTVGYFDGIEWSAPNGVASIDDVVAAIKTYQDPSALNATHLSVSDVHPNLNGTEPNLKVNINDVFTLILGFGGQEFPGPDLTQCP